MVHKGGSRHKEGKEIRVKALALDGNKRIRERRRRGTKEEDDDVERTGVLEGWG